MFHDDTVVVVGALEIGMLIPILNGGSIPACHSCLRCGIMSLNPAAPGAAASAGATGAVARRGVGRDNSRRGAGRSANLELGCSFSQGHVLSI